MEVWAATMTRTIAILCSDLHLSHICPPARAAEPDWYAAMDRMLGQVRDLANENRCPVICAGDVFDRWNSPPELINWAIDHLLEMYAIPGQHDLPMHNYKDIERSAYWTLIQAGVVHSIPEGMHCRDIVDGCVVVGWPFGMSDMIESPRGAYGDDVKLAVAHSYVWIQGKSYPGAPKETRLGRFNIRLHGYDAAVFGDNHQPFLTKSLKCNVINPGCLIRRKSDERGIHPCVGLLQEDGTIVKQTLDASDDKWVEIGEELEQIQTAEGLTEFLDGLKGLETYSLDFKEEVRRYVNDNKLGDETKRILLEVMGE